MEALIRITTDAQGALVVSARELHYFLEVKARFNDWFTGRIKEHGLIEGLTHDEVGDFPEMDFTLTLDAAKELATAEGNDKGKKAYQYFIDCERIAQAQAAFPPADFTQVLTILAHQNQLLMQYNERFMAIESKVSQIANHTSALSKKRDASSGST